MPDLPFAGLRAIQGPRIGGSSTPIPFRSMPTAHLRSGTDANRPTAHRTSWHCRCRELLTMGNALRDRHDVSDAALQPSCEGDCPYFGSNAVVESVRPDPIQVCRRLRERVV